eukprot:2333623-Prymnesium_polylepis.1
MQCAAEVVVEMTSPAAPAGGASPAGVDVVFSPPPVSRFRHSIVARFVPAMAVCMVWLYLVTYSHGPLNAHVYAAEHNQSFASAPLGTVWDELFSEYYPMTLAMIAGSLIAGSTPLGGGVVAFPIAVLVIGFKPR